MYWPILIRNYVFILENYMFHNELCAFNTHFFSSSSVYRFVILAASHCFYAYLNHVAAFDVDRIVPTDHKTGISDSFHYFFFCGYLC